jgi:hypothetical protein
LEELVSHIETLPVVPMIVRPSLTSDLGTKYDYEYYVACVMKSLVGEFTQSGKWSVKGALMGECWKKLCVGIYG